MKNKISARIVSVVVGFGLTLSLGAGAMELDWSGQFRSEAHWVRNYSMESGNLSVDPARSGLGGYYVPGGGDQNTSFQTLFLRLRPKLIVNDNIFIKSEWWLSDPVFGFFGSAAPYTADQRQYYSTQSRGSSITAQRFWAELLSDMGTIQIGRAPLNWGLGLFWNSGEEVWDRYQSTGDLVRVVSKFGNFSVVPALVKYSTGNNIGGACSVAAPVTCNTLLGGSSVIDYSLMFKYENPDEEFEGGLNYVKRIAGPAQDPSSGFLGIGTATGVPLPAGMNFDTWDLYGKKKFSSFTLAGEIPITTGESGIGGIAYKTFAIALEGNWKLSDAWDIGIRAGQAPGQPNIAATENAPDKYRAFYFNPNYRLGLIMFNYQLAGFKGANTANNPSLRADGLVSPFNNPIVNANYLSLGANFRTHKWGFHGSWMLANAKESAASGMNFFNTWEHRFFTNGTGKTQEKFMGWEMDYGTTFFWDDVFQFQVDLGWYFPGAFYKFTNSATADNVLSSVFAAVARIGIVF